MTSNQEAHCVLIVYFQAKALEYLVRGLETSFDVIRRLDAFADIV